MQTKTPESDFEQWANMAIAMRNATEGAGRCEARGGLMCRSEGTEHGLWTMAYFTLESNDEDAPPKPLDRREHDTNDPITHWSKLPEPLFAQSIQATASAAQRRAMFASDVELRVCRFDWRVSLPCAVRDGRLFVAAYGPAADTRIPPGEWRCEAYRIEANGCGIIPEAPLDATEAFLPHLCGSRLVHGSHAGGDALLRARDGAVLNAAEIMAAGASEWAAQAEQPT